VCGGGVCVGGGGRAFYYTYIGKPVCGGGVYVWGVGGIWEDMESFLGGVLLRQKPKPIIFNLLQTEA
jgi:hypothetical protein